MIDINYEINKLLNYSLNRDLINKLDYNYSANCLISMLGLKEFNKVEIEEPVNLYDTLDRILDYAVTKGIIETDSIVYKDLFDSRLMDAVMPRPSEVNKMFWSLYEQNREDATNYYYKLSKDSNYIRMNRIKKNIEWKTKTGYGDIDLTINLSKPEKDPKAIAKAKEMLKISYPKCLLCKENEGYGGHLGHPGRRNHRIIQICLNEDEWYLQYSPYVYFNEHSIVFRGSHSQMSIGPDTFKELLDFVSIFPHYFIGSNADLPIVGGSILSHEHYQAGRYDFAMMKRDYKQMFTVEGFEHVEAGIIDWPMSTIKLRSESKGKLVRLGTHILKKWFNYSDKSADLISHTNGERHNTITPIARFNNGKYELYLVLRNNRTTEEHQLGIFHPHEEHHHLKKENIGLIEVMGLAVLPARLKQEIGAIKNHLQSNVGITENSLIKKHESWIKEIKTKYSNYSKNDIDQILSDEIGYKFVDILAQCGVLKTTEHYMRFINKL
ncbi:UDP-glucose--hexose-1-phosphate uridylyltransferase [Haloplasma contractile]|uniref:Galactose-1-phosphate uridylyltransferase n=1 Tax=Haloplasma contractile SSD-17B TaxID=1033810 RepID=U2DXV8_9MOLU|nr:UDP-glucose--hexose-1-phosphate uridylyltransferase [Haloplasma contractile]ERJ13097.1 Galactose-1-phosphate uridylyltransferase protein [Haloplasma contractile SSD-17B]